MHQQFDKLLADNLSNCWFLNIDSEEELHRLPMQSPCAAHLSLLAKADVDSALWKAQFKKYALFVIPNDTRLECVIQRN